MTEPLAWIGTGNMGFPMAENLLKNQWDLAVTNRSIERAEPLARLGAKLSKSVGEAVAGRAVAATLLSDDEAVRVVAEGPGGLLERLPKGGIHISFSTLSPGFVEDLANRHEERGQILVAAPVFGRPDRAKAATLTIVTAGPAAVLDRLEPLFKSVGSNVFRVGDEPWKANWVKILGNFTLGGLLETLAETLALARRVDLPPAFMVDILDTALYRSPVIRNYGTLMAEEAYEPAGFRMRLGLKDLNLVATAASKLEVPLPLADLVRDGFMAGLHRGYENFDWSALAKVRAEDAGADRRD